MFPAQWIAYKAMHLPIVANQSIPKWTKQASAN
jgi:hypothetical protein